MTTDEILLAAIRSRHSPEVEMCAAAGCYATRPARGQQPNGWSRISVGAEGFVFCPRCGAVDGDLRKFKRCVDRCQWLVRAVDN